MFKTDMCLMNYQNAGYMSCESEMLTETCLMNYRHELSAYQCEFKRCTQRQIKKMTN